MSKTFTPSRFCDKRYAPHARYTIYPRSDQPDSNIGVCKVCGRSHEYDKVTFEGVFHTSLASNPEVKDIWR